MNHYFIGIPVSEPIRQELVSMQEELKQHMEYKVWTEVEDFHITLKFLGGCSDERIESLLSDLLHRHWPAPFPLQIGPAGFFGNPVKPRVFHAEVSLPASLEEMKSLVEECGKSQGFPNENRKYYPHITLAKKQAEGKSPLLEEGAEPGILQERLEMMVERVNVYKIHPEQKPKYECIAAIPLRIKE
ncbi:UNVERIFIED_CONTAM: RNA 2',3'-cyclic phosphodiesterase [Halobacillus marinus]|uniref:RNA 2',3'-cyclic phosphodiesterase n=1 Tax=Bacillaceae TaxID=186817 RepID=UPI0002A4E27A|nr:MULTISPECIES: RNA 2',3'-cyclic phosphodiesterase [Bacillaceae]ELK47352.1 2'-5' RNA ligase family protein [Halobacillus sp. BAB-2008]QHT47462.1 RNA 2',3'-cyclic phosphodiesterase [Bacillus sp. SB49]